ncbi:type VI secretion system baseplate subunit TssG [Pseudomonas sp. CCM 7891]|uniref:Type VI secretion system baseplate subunit TssG n=1 Tax=Pseudomonas karstica TaxID=1055468 RepID=A0A7X2RS95_9PSED|nr:type VI secretion system baseplate subunit TssG [Pseudomonas karstica]MTD18982.1 type VI secretion system baseplate subunit TssG [Pseudomonas karstica]
MVTSHGPAALALTELSRSVREYSLFQAILQVVERLRVAHPSLDEDALYDQLEFQANPGLGFPGNDIESVEFFQDQGQWRARLQLNVLGLVGAGSPLPAFYGEQALAQTTRGNPTRDFLDVFHHRLQRLMLPIWRKYRYQACFRPGARDPFSEQMFALVGLGGSVIRDAIPLNCKRLLPYLGLLSLRTHSAALVETVLRYYFKHRQLYVEQWVERVVLIAHEQRNCLGGLNSLLGNDLVLGCRVADRSGKFRVHVQALDWQHFHEFLPTGTGYQPLCALIRFSVRDPLEYDIRLVLAKGEARPLHIGEHNICGLGWTSWLGHDRADGAVTLASKIH